MADPGFGITLKVNLDEGTDKAINDLRDKIRALSQIRPINIGITKSHATNVNAFATAIQSLDASFKSINAGDLATKINALNQAFSNPPTKYAAAIDKIAKAFDRLGVAAKDNKSVFEVFKNLSSKSGSDASKTAEGIDRVTKAVEAVSKDAPNASRSMRDLNDQLRAQQAITKGVRGKILDLESTAKVSSFRERGLRASLNEERKITQEINQREARLSSITQRADGSLKSFNDSIKKLSANASKSGLVRLSADLDLLRQHFTDLNKQGKTIDFDRAASQVRNLLNQSAGGQKILSTIQGRVVAYREEADALEQVVAAQKKLLADRGASKAMQKLAEGDSRLAQKFLSGSAKAPLSFGNLSKFLQDKQRVENAASRAGKTYAEQLSKSASGTFAKQTELQGAVSQSFKKVKTKSGNLFDFLAKSPGDALGKAVGAVSVSIIKESTVAGQKVKDLGADLSKVANVKFDGSNLQQFVNKLSGIRKEAQSARRSLESVETRLGPGFRSFDEKLRRRFERPAKDARGIEALAAGRLNQAFTDINTKVNKTVSGISKFSQNTSISTQKIQTMRSLLRDVNFALSQSGDIVSGGLRKQLEASRSALQGMLGTTGAKVGESGSLGGIQKLIDIGASVGGVISQFKKLGGFAGGVTAVIGRLGAALASALVPGPGWVAALVLGLMGLTKAVSLAISGVTGLFKLYIAGIRGAIQATGKLASIAVSGLARGLQAVFLPLTGIVSSLRQVSRYLPLIAAFASKRFILKQAADYSKLDDVLTRINTNMGIFTLAPPRKKDETLIARPFESAEGRANEVAIAIRRRFVRASAESLATLEELTNASLLFSKAGLGATFSIPGRDEDDITGIQKVVELANATGNSLEDAARATISAIRIFSIDAKNVGDVVGTIRSATANAQIEVSDFTSSLTEAGAASKIAGLDFQETAALITKMAQSGVSPSKTGTALRRVVTDVLVSAKKDRENINKLLTIAAGTPTVLEDYLDDSQAQFRNLGDEGSAYLKLLKDLQTAGLSLPDLQDLVGSRGQQFINLFTGAGIDSVKKLVEEFRKSGKRLGTEQKQFENTFEGIKKRLDGLRQAIFFSLIEPFEGRAIKAGQSFVTQLKAIFDSVFRFGFQDSISRLVTSAFGGSASRIVSLFKSISKALATVNSIALVFISQFVGSGLKAFEGSAQKITEYINSWFTQDGTSDVIVFIERLKVLADSLGPIFERFFAALRNANFTDIGQRLKATLKDALAAAVEVFAVGLAFVAVDFIQRLLFGFASLAQAVGKLFTASVVRNIISLEGLLPESLQPFGDLADKAAEKFGIPLNADDLTDSLAFIGQEIAEKQAEIRSLDLLKGIFAGSDIQEALSNLINNEEGILSAPVDELTASFLDVRDAINEANDAYVDLQAILDKGKARQDLIEKLFEKEKERQKRNQGILRNENFIRNLREQQGPGRASLVESAQLFERIQLAGDVQDRQLAELVKANELNRAILNSLGTPIDDINSLDIARTLQMQTDENGNPLYPQTGWSMPFIPN